MAARLTAFLVAAIVGVTFVAGLIVGAQRDDDGGTIDLVIYNGRVFTGDAEAPIAEAVAIRGNRIYRVGTNREIKRLSRRATTMIDAHGGSVLPGFSDTFTRLPVLTADVTDAGRGDGPGPAAGAGATGGPLVPAPQPDEPRVALREAIDGAHRLGLTSVGALVEDRQAIETFETVQKDSPRPMRVVAALKVQPPLSAVDMDALQALRRETVGPSLLRLDAIAIDVTVPAPLPAPRRGRARAEAEAPLLPEAEQQAILALDERGWPLVLQVDDERELSGALDALARVIETNPAPPAGRRHRLALGRAMPLDTTRLSQLGVTISVPLSATWLAEQAGDDVPAGAGTRAGLTTAEVGDAALPVRGAESPIPFAFPLPAGVRLVMASDTLADPRLGLQALLAPSANSARPAETDQAADANVDTTRLAQALATLTSAAARALGDDSMRGTIGPDKLADLVILSADIFALPAARLLDAVVIATIVDGKVVYDRETETPQTDQD